MALFVLFLSSWLCWQAESQDRLALEGRTSPCTLAASGEDGLAGDLMSYKGLLLDLRSGNAETREELLARAWHLQEQHGRSDCVAIAQYYLGLSAEALRLGVEVEREVNGLWESVTEISEQTPGELEKSWLDSYTEIATQLLDCAQRAQRGGDIVPAATALAFAAELERYLAQGDEPLLKQARQHALDALAHYDRSGHLRPRLHPLLELGRVQRGLGERTAARQSFEACIALAERLDQVDYALDGILGMVTLARDRGDVHHIDQLLARAVELQSPKENWPLALECAHAILSGDRSAEALDFLREVRPAKEKELCQWYSMLCNTHMRRGDLVAAWGAFAELERLEESLDSSSAVTVLTRARLNLQSQDPRAVLEALGPRSLAEFGVQAQAQRAVLLGEACLEIGEFATAVEWLEEAVATADEWATGKDMPLLDNEEKRAGSVFGEWLGLHAVVLLAEAHVRQGNPTLAAAVIETSQTRGLRNRARVAAVNAAAGDSRLRLEPDEQSIRSWAANFELGLVTWCIGADRSIAIHVAADGTAEAKSIAMRRSRIERAVRCLREVATDGVQDRALSWGNELAVKLLPESFLQALSASAPSARALFVLHGALERLPLPLLVVSGKALGARCTPIVLPGLTQDSVPLLTYDPKQTPLWLCGNPMDDLGQPLLQGAQREIQSLSNRYPLAQVASGPTFDAASLQAALRSGAALHIATHLEASEACDATHFDPSALVLSNGAKFCVDTVRKIAPRSPLVVLSTCESAGKRLLDGEGLQGLARTFLESGSENLLVTLWPVSDRAAERAAEIFHMELGDGQSPAHAARNVVARLAEEGFSSADWAAYRFLGRN